MDAGWRLEFVEKDAPHGIIYDTQRSASRGVGNVLHYTCIVTESLMMIRELSEDPIYHTTMYFYVVMFS